MKKRKKRIFILLLIAALLTCNLQGVYAMQINPAKQESIAEQNPSQEITENHTENPDTTDNPNAVPEISEDGNTVPDKTENTEEEPVTEEEFPVQPAEAPKEEPVADGKEPLDLSQNGFVGESVGITNPTPIDLSHDNASSEISLYSYTGPTYSPDSYGRAIRGFSGLPAFIKKLPANKQNDLMKPENTIPIGGGTATKLNSNVSMLGDGRITFNRIKNKKTNYGKIVQYENGNAGYIRGRAITSKTWIWMISDSTSDSYLGETSCLAVQPGKDMATNLDGISVASMYPGYFDSGTGSLRSKPLNSFVFDVEIRYKDTGEIVPEPLDLYISDLDVFQNAFYVPEAVHFDDTISSFSTYDRTQLRYNSSSPMWGFPKGFIGSPNNNAVGGTDSTFLRGGHAKTKNGKFRIGFTDCNCSSFLNVGSPDYAPLTGTLKLKKTIAQDEHLTSLCPEQYTLAGAEYTVYKESTCKTEVGKLITTEQKKGSDGKLYAETNTLNIAGGTYYVKETKAPKGYKVDKRMYPVELKNGQTTVLPVKDVPMFDPMTLTLQKHIPKGKNWTKQYLKDAEYTVRYYTKHLNTPEEVAKETPLRTWIFKTDSNGTFQLIEENPITGELYHIGGDELFKKSNGMVVGLYGTYTFEETKAPPGFIKNEGITIRQIHQGIKPEDIDDINHGDAANVAAEEVNTSVHRQIVATKKISEENVYAPYGVPTAIFELVGTDVYGNVCTYRKSITLDSSTLKNGYYTGTVVFDHLPAGLYDLFEVKTSRYTLKGITEVTANGTVEGEVVHFELVNSTEGKATYENEISRWNDLSDTDCVVNRF